MHRLEFSVGEFLSGSKTYHYYTIAEYVMLELCQLLKANCYFTYYESLEPDSQYYDCVLFRNDNEYIVRYHGNDDKFQDYETALQFFYKLVSETIYPISWGASDSVVSLELHYDLDLLRGGSDDDQ